MFKNKIYNCGQTMTLTPLYYTFYFIGILKWFYHGRFLYYVTVYTKIINIFCSSGLCIVSQAIKNAFISTNKTIFTQKPSCVISIFYQPSRLFKCNVPSGRMFSIVAVSLPNIFSIIATYSFMYLSGKKT